MIHSTFLSTCETIEWPLKKRPMIQLDSWMSTSFQYSQATLYRRIGINDAWPHKTIPNRNGRLEIRYWCGSYPIGFKWRSPSHILYLKNPFPCQTELRNLWQRITRYHLRTWRMVTLHSRIYTYHCHFIQSQKPHLLPRSQETDKTTSTMISISLRIRC